MKHSILHKYFLLLALLLCSIVGTNAWSDTTVTWTPSSAFTASSTPSWGTTVGSGDALFYVYDVKGVNSSSAGSFTWASGSLKLGDNSMTKAGIAVYVPTSVSSTISSIKFYMYTDGTRHVFYASGSSMPTSGTASTNALATSASGYEYNDFSGSSSYLKGTYYVVGGRSGGSGATYITKIEITFASSCTNDDANFIFSSATASATIGTAFISPTLTNTNSHEVTYSSDNENVATVDNTGTVTLKSAGSAKITAVGAAISPYCSTSTSYILTVSSCTAETPQAPTVSATSVCAGTDLTFTSGSTAATGQTWYWQTSATGTATTSVSTAPYTLSTTGLSGTQTMYLRSTCDGGTTWGTASSVSSTVNSAPTITTQPSGGSYAVGSSPSLSVVASNVTGYQWYSNTSNSKTGGTAITGATSASYSPSTTSAGTKYYYCVLSNDNSCGTTTSSVATVNVVACTSTSISGTTTVAAGSQVTLSEASSIAGSWSSGNTSVATVNSSTGVVTGVAGGSAIITFTPTDNTTYCTSTATITVTAAAGSLNGAPTLSSSCSGLSWTYGTPGYGYEIKRCDENSHSYATTNATNIGDLFAATGGTTSSAYDGHGYCLNTGYLALGRIDDGVDAADSDPKAIQQTGVTGHVILRFENPISITIKHTRALKISYSTDGTTFTDYGTYGSKDASTELSHTYTMNVSGYYYIKLSNAEVGNWARVSSVSWTSLDCDATTTTETSASSAPTAAGYYCVRALSAAATPESEWSTPVYYSPTPAAASVTVTPSYATAALSWTAVDNATSYAVYNGTTLVGTTANTSYDLSGLTPGTAYTTYTVRALNDNSCYVTPSALSFTTLALVAPTATAATDLSISGFTANWTAPASVPADYTYTVTVYDASNAVVKTISGISSSSLSASVTGLNPSTTYHYTVSLVETTSSNSATSSSVSVTTLEAVALTVKMVDLSGIAVDATVSYDGTAYSAGTVNVTKGASSSLTANAPALSVGNYAFIKWLVDGVSSTTNPYTATFTTPTTLTAIYSPLHCDSTYDLSGSSTMLHTTLPARGWSMTNLNGYSSGYEWFKYSGTSVKSPTIDRLAKVVVGGVHIKSYSSSSTYSVKFNIVALLDNGTEETVYSRTMYRNVETDYSNPQDAVAYMPSNAIAFRVETPSSSSGSSDVNVGINRITYCTSDSIDNTAPKLYYDPYNTETDVAIAKVPVLKFSEPIYVLSNGSLVKAAASDFTTSNIAIYKYNSTTSTYDESTNLATGLTWGKTTVARDSMLLGSDTLKIAHSTAFEYNTKYKIALKDSVFYDAAGNVISSAYSVFTTEQQPIPIIQILDQNHNEIATGSTQSMGMITASSISSLTKTFYITNKGNGTLKVYAPGTASYSRVGGTGYTISSFLLKQGTAAAVDAAGQISGLTSSDTIIVTVTFAKQGTNGKYTGYFELTNSSGYVYPTGSYVNGSVNCHINLTAIQAAFMLPYTYESGLTTPIYTNQLIQDYTSVSDIPEEITINGEVPKNGYNFYSNYKVFAAEGGCMVNGNSALRVGKQSSTVDNRLHIQSSAYKGVGNITLSWSATGVRKVKIYSGTSGTVYYQSPSWEAASTCHQTSVNVNNCSEGVVDLYVEFDGVEDSMLTTLYYLHIDTCSTDENTDAYIFAFSDKNGDVGRVYSGAEGGEDNRIYVSSTNCADGEGASATLAASVITVSPNATVSPAVGEAATIKSETGSDGTVSYYFPYTVTSQDRQYSRTYKVYVDCVKPDTAQCYENTATIKVENVTADDSIQILEMRSATCTIPVAGSYTIHYFNEDSIDAHPYVYSIYPVGSSQTATDGYYYLCTNQTQEFGLKIFDSNKKEVTPNNATYRWTILKNNDANVTLVNGTDSVSTKDGKTYSYYDGTTAFIKAPSVLPTASANSISVSITLSLSFGSKCVFLSSDTAHAKIKVTEANPDTITAVTAGCMTGSKLIITATMPKTGIPATGWSWAVYSADEKTNYAVMNRDKNVATIELNNTTPDLIAYVTANGCGTKIVPSGKLPVNYASDSTTWIGKTSSDWLTQSNWTRRVPWACTDVTINPVSVAPNYPVIDRAKADSAACHRILFRPEAGVLNLDVLDYDSAFVQTTLSRNKWYSMTAPLKSMYSGDFYMQGNPLTYMRLFNPGTTKTSTWTATFSSLLQELTPGEGFAYEISGNGYDRSGTAVKKYSGASSDFTLQFPRTTLEGGTSKSMDAKIISYVVPFSKFSGKLLTALSDTLVRTKPYRFSMENDNNKMETKTITLSNGYNLIANPMMTHLDIGAFLSANSTIIGSVIWKWNGKSSSSVIYNGSDYSVLSASQPIVTGQAGYYIPPMQSFIVSSTGGNVTINPTTMFAAATSGSPTLKSTSSADEYQRIYVTSTKGDLTTSMMIGKNANATNGYDENYDAHKLFSPYVGEQATPYPYAKEEIYTIVDGEQLDINQFKTSPYVVPVNMTLYGTKDTVTIKVSGADSFVNDKIELVNVATGESQDLKDNNSYVFAYDSTTAAGALFINISPLQNVVTGVNNGATSGSISVFVKSGNTIRVVSAVVTDPIVTVSLYDLSGRLVSQNTNINAAVFDKQMNDGQRPYIVKVQTLNSDKVQKVFIK